MDVDLQMIQAWLMVAPPSKCIQYLLCCFINMEDQILHSQIACHTFLCLSQPRTLWNYLMETRNIPKELGLFYVAFLTVWSYIQLDQFIIVQVTLPTLSHQLPSNFMLVSKKLHLNLLKIVIFLTIKVVLGDHHTRLFKYKLSKSTLTETIILLSQLSVDFQNKIYLDLFRSVLFVSLLPY